MPVVTVKSRTQIIESFPDEQICLISISNPDYEYSHSVPTAGWNDVLEIQFDDIERSWMGWIPITATQARDIYEFIIRNLGKDFVVHCDAGVSRSMAVGCFIHDFFNYGLDLQSYDTTEYRNKLVYSLLKEIHEARRDGVLVI